jgi:hypothetical protein
MLARPDVGEVYERRQALYAKVATLIVPTDGRSPYELTLDILVGL